MSLLRQGASPKRNLTANMKKLSVEIYESVSIEFQAHQFHSGSLGMMVSNESLASRLNAETDNGLRMYSGLISKEQAKHPSWQEDLMRPLLQSDTAALAYLSPTHNENFTRLSAEVSNGDSADVLHCPGAWVLQMVANNISNFYALLDHVFETTLLNDGWSFNGFLLQEENKMSLLYFCTMFGICKYYKYLHVFIYMPCAQVLPRKSCQKEFLFKVGPLGLKTLQSLLHHVATSTKST